MSFREHASNIMDNLIASGIYSAAILAVLKLWPWIVTKFTALRIAAAVVPALLIGRLRAALLRRRAGATPEPFPMMPTFANNSMVMHWEAAQQQQAALAAHFPTMPRFSAATLQIN